ncbi:MAG: protein TolR [Deltaproteobacteria bacterium]
MAMQMNVNRGRGKKTLVSEINVTPLVDVMLVLLIIFMVTAPMLTQGLDVNLPETTAKALPQKEDPVTVTINKKQQIFLNKIKVDQQLLQQQLGNLASKGKDRPIFLNADREVPYGTVVSVMADIKAAGFDKLGMITKPKERNR